MVITNTNIAMTSSSSIMQRYTQEIRTTNRSNPSLFNVSTTSTESLQLQYSSHTNSSRQAARTNTNEYKNPAYKKQKNDSVHGERDQERGKHGDTSKISDEARQLAKARQINSSKTHGVKSVRNGPDSFLTDFKYNFLNSIIKLLSGGKSDIFTVNPFLDSGKKFSQVIKELEGTKIDKTINTNLTASKSVLVHAESLELNFRPVTLQQLDITTSFKEEQNMKFQASGSVTTSDGRQINLEVNLSMSSEFYNSNQTTVMQVLKDPLVINFGGGPVELTQTKFDFDIDSDGKKDQISFATGGSGFIALDKNGDGIINDGSELFGAMTGDGFKELAQYDKDGNGWIDEADDIFDNLRIWSKDENGKDRLVALGESGIGAIYLGNVATDYNLRADDGSLNGQIRQTGVFLYENGGAGTIHQVDIAV